MQKMNKPKDAQEYDGYEIHVDRKITPERRKFLEEQRKEYEKIWGKISTTDVKK